MVIRRRLPHDPPLGVATSDSLFFITVCSSNHGSQDLLEHSRPEVILSAVRHRHEAGLWFCRVFLVMPDHVHALIRFCHPSHPMRQVMLDFKHWTARAGHFQWHGDFFDHRLRHEESTRNKADYILQNPVRAGLVSAEEEWPHRFMARDVLG